MSELNVQHDINKERSNDLDVPDVTLSTPSNCIGSVAFNYSVELLKLKFLTMYYYVTYNYLYDLYCLQICLLIQEKQN